MNKTALITGASRGIGAAIARTLHREGWSLVLNYHQSRTAAESLARELNARLFCADVADPNQARALADFAGPVELLVCNAGLAQYGLFTQLEDTQWSRTLAVNLDGVANCCRAVLPTMVREKRGCILNLSSMWGITGASCEAAYAAAKAGVIGLTRSLAKEYGPSGIRVNAIAPGVIETDMLSSFSHEERRALAEETPLGRLGRPEDVAELCAFLASDRAAFITGQTISVDGGFIL